ncbi:MAG: tetratricopeptide repeat protein, partial [Spirochaetota bacterium]
GLSGLAAKNNEAELYAAQTRAEELESQEQFYNAIEVWQRVLHETPHSSRAYLGIARSYMRLARYNEALGFVEQALLLANQDYPISILKSRILMGLQRYDEAKEILLKLKEIHPSFQVDLALSELFVILGDVAQGVEYLNAIKSFAGNDLHFLLTSLMVYEEAGKLDHAYRYLRQVLDSYYNEAVVHKVAAGYYLRRGRYGDVLEEIDIIKRLGIDSENLRLLGLEAAYLKGDFQLAINLAETLVTLYPKNSEAWYLLGLGYSNTAQLEKALHALNTARRIDPDNEFVKIVIAEILRTRYPYPSEWHSREGKRYVASAQVKRDNLLYKKALQDYRSALQIDPLNEENWMSFANVFRDRGHYAKYLDKLYAWREFGVPKAEGVESKLAELIRIYEASQSQNVAQKWGLQQYAFPNNFYPVRVFVVKGSSFDYVGATRELGSYFVNVLQWYEQPFVVGDIQMVDDRLQAQQAAHVGGSSDYYIILDFTRQAGGLRSEVALYLSSTGRQVAQYVAERVSNGKIYNSFVYLAAQLQELFPKKASVVEVKVNDVVLSLGSLDGVEKGQKWLVLPESALRQSVGNPFGEYKESDVIGTVTIEQADEKISGGKVQLNSFIRPVEKGYIALQWQERETTEEERANPTLLQEPNIGLQNRFFELS